MKQDVNRRLDWGIMNYWQNVTEEIKNQMKC